MRHFSLLGFAVFSAVTAGIWTVGCGSPEDSVFVTPPPDAGSPDAEEYDPSFGDNGPGEGVTGCHNLECFQQACPEDADAKTTTIKGKVYDPRGVNPLYNALVYIPNGKLQEFDDNAPVSCDQCRGTFATGNPLVAVSTKADGSFELTNVPVGVDLPIVVQVGKWRRAITLPKVEACKVTEFTNPQTFRLPRNKVEGNIPRTAIAIGGADPFECLLRKIGIDDSEFTLPDGTGRVHMYRAHDYTGNSATIGAYATGPAANQRMPPVSSMWGDKATLGKHDVSLLPCEGTPTNGDKPADIQQTQGSYDNVKDYLNAGGRVFLTHYSKTFIEGLRDPQNTSPIVIPSHFGAVGNFNYQRGDRSDVHIMSNGTFCFPTEGVCNGGVTPNPTLNGTVDTSFPKGKAFADWLLNTKASTTLGQLPLVEWRHNLETVNKGTPTKPLAQPWITADTRTAWPNDDARSKVGAAPVTQHITFNTPLDAPLNEAGEPNQCGKVVFSDFHVAELARNRNANFPASCGNPAVPMTPQEKALEFMLFDLSACIQKENAPPLQVK
jgi:hypothetical protein